MTLASAARHFGKKSILLLPEEVLDGEPLYRESQHHTDPGGILSSLITSGVGVRVGGRMGAGFAPLSERTSLVPGGELDLIFQPVGHFWPPSPLLTAKCGPRRWQAKLQANELVGLLIPAWC